MKIDMFVHIANVLYLISYLVKDIFLLRFITVLATLVLVSFYLLQGNNPLWAPIIWAGVFTVVNTYQIYLLFKERRPVILSQEDDEIYQEGFSSFSLRQFAKLLKFGQKEQVKGSKCLFEEGGLIDKVIFIIDGTAFLEKNGSKIKELSKGDLVTEVDIIKDQASNYKVCVNDKSRLLYWERDKFDEMLSKDSDINSSWQSMISFRLAKKLSAS